MHTLSHSVERLTWINELALELLASSTLMSPDMAAGFATDLWPVWGHVTPEIAAQFFLDPAVEYPSQF